jgi:hypothetical protein
VLVAASRHAWVRKSTVYHHAGDDHGRYRHPGSHLLDRLKGVLDRRFFFWQHPDTPPFHFPLWTPKLTAHGRIESCLHR